MCKQWENLPSLILKNVQIWFECFSLEMSCGGVAPPLQGESWSKIPSYDLDLFD